MVEWIERARITSDEVNYKKKELLNNKNIKIGDMKFTKCHSTYPLRERRPGAQLALSLDGSLAKR